jgi:DUF4097 and DUF4098 domain-containing protein YvlB
MNATHDKASEEAVVKKAMTIISAAILMASAGCAESEYDETFELTGNIDKVVVETSTGDIDVTGSEDDGATVNVELSCKTATPEVHVDLDGTTLTVSMDAGNGASACDGLFSLDIPAGAELEIRTGIGDVILDGIDGDTEALTYDGDIDLVDLSGDLDLTTASGDVTTTGLSGSEVTITAGAGRVEASFETIPALVDVEVTSGSAALTVPSSAYLVEAEADDGQVEVSGLVEQDSAASELWVAVTTGDIIISGK